MSRRIEKELGRLLKSQKKIEKKLPKLHKEEERLHERRMKLHSKLRAVHMKILGVNAELDRLCKNLRNIGIRKHELNEKKKQIELETQKPKLDALKIGETHKGKFVITTFKGWRGNKKIFVFQCSICEKSHPKWSQAGFCCHEQKERPKK